MGLYVVSVFMSWLDSVKCVWWFCYLVLCCTWWVRYASPSGPICLRCLMLTLSYPVELFAVLPLGLVMVSVIVAVCSLCVFLSNVACNYLRVSVGDCWWCGWGNLEFISEIQGLHPLVIWCILCLVCSGKSLCVMCIFAFLDVMFICVKMVFLVCIFFGGWISEKVAYV